MEFNEKLQELRKNKGLTQEELAEALYVSRTAISKWESGRGYPSIDSLKEIAKYFSVTIQSRKLPNLALVQCVLKGILTSMVKVDLPLQVNLDSVITDCLKVLTHHSFCAKS